MTKREKFERLKGFLAKLDSLLTGKSFEVCFEHAQKSDTVFGLLSGAGVFYFSDGGYSRIGYDDCPDKLYLTYNSLDAVRQRWYSGDEDIENLKEEIRKLVVDLYGYKGEKA